MDAYSQSHILDDEDYFDIESSPEVLTSISQTKSLSDRSRADDQIQVAPNPHSQRGATLSNQSNGSKVSVNEEYENTDNLGNQLDFEEGQSSNSRLIRSGRLIRENKRLVDEDRLLLVPPEENDYENTLVLEEMFNEEDRIYENQRELANPIYSNSVGLTTPPSVGQARGLSCELEPDSVRVYGIPEPESNDDILELKRPFIEQPDYENSEILDEILFGDNITLQNGSNSSPDGDSDQSNTRSNMVQL